MPWVPACLHSLRSLAYLLCACLLAWVLCACLFGCCVSASLAGCCVPACLLGWVLCVCLVGHCVSACLVESCVMWACLLVCDVPLGQQERCSDANEVYLACKQCWHHMLPQHGEGVASVRALYLPHAWFRMLGMLVCSSSAESCWARTTTSWLMVQGDAALQAAPMMFLYLQHPQKPVAAAAHSLFCAVLKHSDKVWQQQS